MATFTELAYDLTAEIKAVADLFAGGSQPHRPKATFHSLRARIANVLEEAIFHNHPRKEVVQHALLYMVDASAAYRRAVRPSRDEQEAANDWSKLDAYLRQARTKLMSFVGCNDYEILYHKTCGHCENETSGHIWLAKNFPSRAAALESLEKNSSNRGYKVEVVSIRQVGEDDAQ